MVLILVFPRLLASLGRAWDADRRLAKSHRPALQIDVVIGAPHPRSKTREDARGRFGHSHQSLLRPLAHRGSHVLPGPLQINHSGGPTTAAADAINERDAAPDAAVRRPPRRARGGRGENPRPQQNHEAATRGDEAADYS